MPKYTLTKEQKDAMRAVKNGADVFDFGIARRLREAQRNHPELIAIGQAAGDYGDGRNREPYFGAKLTARGKSAIV